jgi:hypothetical protein
MPLFSKTLALRQGTTGAQTCTPCVGCAPVSHQTTVTSRGLPDLFAEER